MEAKKKKAVIMLSFLPLQPNSNPFRIASAITFYELLIQFYKVGAIVVLENIQFNCFIIINCGYLTGGNCFRRTIQLWVAKVIKHFFLSFGESDCVIRNSTFNWEQ